MNEWVDVCVFRERNVCLCVCWLFIYIYSLTCKIEICESCVCFQYFWKWLSSFWSYLINCYVCERMNEWVDCVFRERNVCLCVCWLFIYIYIHSHPRLRDVRVVFVFNASESNLTPSDLIQSSVVCKNEWMNGWMSMCVCVFRERNVCLCWLFIYVYSLTFKIKRCESCVCFQCFWKWLNSFWFYLISCCVCVCVCVRMNEWVNVCD
jgi:hypothetical protein